MDIIVHPVVILVIVVGLIVLLAAAFLLGRHLPRRRYPLDELSAVTRQHIDLIQGGQINETAVESAKARFRMLLERGEVEVIEASLRPGTHYVEQVRALAEIGTDDAGKILERQLQRRLTEDQIEQFWYWIDLANSLRTLNREQSLPHLLRCAERAEEMPLGNFLAAETACFLGFAGYLRQPESSLGRAALRVLHRALEGLRMGVPPQVVAEGRLGEAVENLWDNLPEQVDPLVVRVLAEALRQLRRASNADVAFADEISEKEAYHWQMSRLAALEEVFKEYLKEAPGKLASALGSAEPAEQREILSALADLKADVAAAVLPLFERSDFSHAELAVEVLSWSRDPQVAAWLRTWVIRNVPVVQRAQRRRKALPGRHRSLPHGFPYQAVLHALRRHPSRETEMFLLLAARDWDPTYRAAALGSFGWWEPWHRPEVLMFLQESRRDPSAEVRQVARAALARLGERQALQTFRQALTSEDSQRVHEAIHAVSSEGITLLWPDLDRLADAEDVDIAHHAREALEVLCEEMDQR